MFTVAASSKSSHERNVQQNGGDLFKNLSQAVSRRRWKNKLKAVSTIQNWWRVHLKRVAQQAVDRSLLDAKEREEDHTRRMQRVRLLNLLSLCFGLRFSVTSCCRCSSFAWTCSPLSFRHLVPFS